MKFRDLRLRNFLSFGDEEQFIHFVDNDIILVLGQNLKEGGSNGAGKTTLYNAIVWAIYGKTTKGLQADDVVNNITNRDCMVQLDFTIDNKYISIKRWRKINGKKNKNKISLKVNGNDVSLANMADTQDKINNLIKINFRSFISSVMFSQDRIFNFTDASQSKRKEIIENVLQVDNLGVYEKLLKNDVVELQRLQENKYHQQVSKKNMANSLVTNIQDYLTSCKFKSKQLISKIKDMSRDLGRLEKIDGDRELEKHKENDILKNQEKKLIKSMDELKIKKNNARDKLDTLSRHVKEKVSRKNKILDKLKIIKKELQKAENDPSKCPLCGNVINPHLIKKYISERKNSITVYKKELSVLNDDVDKLKIKLDEVNSSILDYEERIKKLNEKIDKIKYVKPKISLDELQKLVEEKIDLRSKIQMLNDQKNNIVDLKFIESIKTQIKEARASATAIEKDLENIQNTVKHYSFWLHAFSKGENTIRSFLVNKIIDFINSRIKHYLNIFFVEEVQFILDREMNHTIFKSDIEISLAQLSGGEEQRLNLAIAFSLFDLVKINLGNDINIIFMDEVLDRNLDENGVTALLKIIDDMKENGNSIYLISHKDNFKAYFNNFVVIYKDANGISKILSAA